ncbi:hypothetical protein ACVNP1_06920 [Staphylococcus aureus]
MQALKTKSNIGEMFNIQEKENGEIAISARELYKTFWKLKSVLALGRN